MRIVAPERLLRELLAAGIPAASISPPIHATPPPEWASQPDALAFFRWVPPDHPTAWELATAETVIAAHDPLGDEKEETAARARLLALAEKLDAGSATAAEQREALAKLVRRHLGVR